MDPKWTYPVVGLVMAALTICVGATAIETEHSDGDAMEMAIVSLADVKPLQRATDLWHMPIRNADLSLNGHVADIMLNTDRTRAEYLAVVFYDSIGRIYQVPFMNLRCTADGRTLICELTPEKLHTVASVPAHTWSGGKNLRRVSHLLGLRARDATGQVAGRIRDLLIDSDRGTVREATVGIGGFLGFREDLASLEWNLVTLRTDHAQLDISAEKLAERGYPKEDYWHRLGFAGEKEEREPGMPMTPYPLTPLNPHY